MLLLLLFRDVGFVQVVLFDVGDEVEFALERFEADLAGARLRYVLVGFVGFDVDLKEFFGAEALVALGALVFGEGRIREFRNVLVDGGVTGAFGGRGSRDLR